MHTIRLLDPAERDLARLDKPVGRRVVERLRWFADHLDELNPEPLSGALAGLLKFRVGDYRVIYEVISEERLIIVHFIGHRREVYKRR